MTALILFALACGGSTPEPDPRVGELVARVNTLERELQTLRDGGTIDAPATPDRPATTAAKPVGATPGVPVPASAELLAKLAELEQRLDELDPIVDDAREQIDDVDDDLAEVEDENEEDAEGLDALKATLVQIEDQLATLDDTVNELDEVLANHITATQGVEKIVKKVRIDQQGNVVFIDAKLLTEGSNNQH